MMNNAMLALLSTSEMSPVTFAIIAGVLIAFATAFVFLTRKSGDGTIVGRALELVASKGLNLASDVALRYVHLQPAVEAQIKALVARYVTKHDTWLAEARSPDSPGGKVITEAERSEISQKAFDFVKANLAGEFKDVAEHLGEGWVKGIIGMVLAGANVFVGATAGGKTGVIAESQS